ncbi:MAG TPA: elongation factor P [Tenericutes bacterium]|jgi:elongation factor P|nr:elongation factor P [Mycoplasmatota bacterium]
MINVNDFKNGVTIQMDGNIYKVLEFQHVKPGKGGAFVRTKLRNLRTGAIIDHTFTAGIKVERAEVIKKEMQYLYSVDDTYVFMDNDTYEQVEIKKSQIEEEIKFLKENMTVEVISYENEILGINLPDKVELVVVKSDPAVSGNTATTAMKDATLETGLLIKVPLFIKESDTVIVNTETGKYDSRK